MGVKKKKITENHARAKTNEEGEKALSQLCRAPSDYEIKTAGDSHLN